MIRTKSLESISTESDVFYVERSSGEDSPDRSNTPAVLKSTQLSGALAREVNTISSVASPEPQIVTIESNSNEPTIPYGHGWQVPIIPLSLIDFNLPLNPFNVMTCISLAPITEAQLHHVEIDLSPIQEDVIDVTDISTPSMLVSSIRETSSDQTPGHSILTSPDESHSLRPHRPHRRLHDNKRKNWAWECRFLREGECGSTTAKPTVNPYQHAQKKSEYVYFNSNSKLQLSYLFITCVHILG